MGGGAPVLAASITGCGGIYRRVVVVFTGGARPASWVRAFGFRCLTQATSGARDRANHQITHHAFGVGWLSVGRRSHVRSEGTASLA